MAAKLLNFFKKEEAFSGGGFFTPGKYKVEEARFIDFDADGKWANSSTVLELVLLPVVKGKKGWVADTKRNEGNAVRQQWSAGKPEFFKPSKTGTGLVQAGDRETLSESCNFYVFLEKLGEAGFELDSYDNDISVLEGYVFEMKNIPAPERNFKSNVDPAKDEAAATTAKNKTLIVVDSIVEAPDGDAPKPKKVTGKKAAEEEEEEGEDTAEETDDDAEEDAAEETEETEEEGGADPEDLLKTYLKSTVCVKANVGGVKVADARTAMFRAMKKAEVGSDDNRSVLKLMNDAKALAAGLKACGWKVDKGIIKK